MDSNMKPVKIFYFLISILAVLGSGSSPDNNADLLFLPVKSTVLITDNRLTNDQQKIQRHTNAGSLRNMIPKLFEQNYPSARKTVYSIKN